MVAIVEPLIEYGLGHGIMRSPSDKANRTSLRPMRQAAINDLYVRVVVEQMKGEHDGI